MKAFRIPLSTSTRRVASLALLLCCSGGAAIAGPGTQTEDDVYVGKKRQAQSAATAPALLDGTRRPVQGATTPGTATPQPRAGAGTSPHTGAAAANKKARAGGADDDLEDLEVERRKVQGVNSPGTTTPLLRPGAGTSPNTGRTAAPGPALGPAPRPAPLPGKPL